MKLHGIQLDEEKIAEFCKRNEIARLSLFGSIVRPDFGADSDVDVLVEFRPGQTPDLLELGGMQMELSEMVGRFVDLKTPGFISERILPRVRASLLVQYAA